MRKLPILLAVIGLAVSLAIPQAAYATDSSHSRVTTLLASNQYVVYKQQTATKPIEPYSFTGGTVYATDSTGQRIALPGFTNVKEPLFLTGSILVQAENEIHVTTESTTVRYLDLKTRKGGTYTGQPNEVLVGAGPDGWLMEHATGDDGVDGSVQQLIYVHRDGTRVDLGVPYPDGQHLQFAVSDTGVVLTPGVSDETRFQTKVLYQPWASIGKNWRTIYTPKGTQTGLFCAPSSTTYVACQQFSDSDASAQPFAYGLISLSGSGAKWLNDTHPKACMRVNFATLNSNLVAIETSDAGVCTQGKLYRFTASGNLISGGSHHYTSNGILTGLGGVGCGSSPKIIVSSIGQRHIDMLTGVTKRPHVVVRV